MSECCPIYVDVIMSSCHKQRLKLLVSCSRTLSCCVILPDCFLLCYTSGPFFVTSYFRTLFCYIILPDPVLLHHTSGPFSVESYFPPFSVALYFQTLFLRHTSGYEVAGKGCGYVRVNKDHTVGLQCYIKRCWCML